MLDAPGDDQHLSGVEGHGLVAKVDPDPTLHHEEELVLVLVMVPDELALQLGQLDVEVVDLADDLRAPVFGDTG